MILVGNQRGGSKDLALHLMKEENKRVEVHELRGFMSDNLMSALNESYAVSRGTKCKQFLYSLSLNPPKEKTASIEDFEQEVSATQSQKKAEEEEQREKLSREQREKREAQEKELAQRRQEEKKSGKPGSGAAFSGFWTRLRVSARKP